MILKKLDEIQNIVDTLFFAQPNLRAAARGQVVRYALLTAIIFGF